MPSDAARWLRDAWPYGEALPPAVVHKGLALVHVCRTLDPSVTATTDAVLADALGRELDFAAPDLLSGLLSALLAVREGLEPAAAYLAALDEVLDEDDTSDESIAALRLALRHPIGGEVHISLDELGPRWFRAGSRGDIGRVLATVEARTGYGTRRAFAETPLPQLVEGAALHAAQRYDIPLVLRSLRACAYVGAGDGFGARAAARFVVLSRCPDGTFGYFATPFANLRGDPRARPANVLALKLAVATQALWTLAELEDSRWRLLATLASPETSCSTPRS